MYPSQDQRAVHSPPLILNAPSPLFLLNTQVSRCVFRVVSLLNQMSVQLIPTWDGGAEGNLLKGGSRSARSCASAALTRKDPGWAKSRVALGFLGPGAFLKKWSVLCRIKT